MRRKEEWGGERERERETERKRRGESEWVAPGSALSQLAPLVGFGPPTHGKVRKKDMKERNDTVGRPSGNERNVGILKCFLFSGE